MVLRPTLGNAFNAASTGNQLLDRLPELDRRNFLPKLQRVALPLKTRLYESRGTIDYVYFPIGAVMSALNVMKNGSAIEVATVGNEGLVGHPAAEGVFISVNRVIVQVADGAWRIEAGALRSAVQASDVLQRLTLKYRMAFEVQVSQSVACNGLHKLESRCCRWLLMTHDRVGADELRLTHELLGIMLGVRRPTVTEALGPLQAAGLVSSHRGKITILNRRGVERKACECYRVVRDEYDRLFASPP
jgi:CRP-like cAMP-binding protein